MRRALGAVCSDDLLARADLGGLIVDGFRSTAGMPPLQHEAATLALDLCPAGTLPQRWRVAPAGVAPGTNLGFAQANAPQTAVVRQLGAASRGFDGELQLPTINHQRHWDRPQPTTINYISQPSWAEQNPEDRLKALGASVTATLAEANVLPRRCRHLQSGRSRP